MSFLIDFFRHPFRPVPCERCNGSGSLHLEDGSREPCAACGAPRLEVLKELLREQALDPRFESYGDFVTIDASAEFFEGLGFRPRGRAVVVHGNFLELSAAFSVLADEEHAEELIALRFGGRD